MRRRICIISCIFSVFIIFLVFYIPYIEWNKNSKKSADFETEILAFRNTLTPELLETFILKKEKISEDISDFKIEQFIDVIKKADIGGYSHPVYEKHLLFIEKKEGIHYVIEIDIGKDGSRKFTNVKISVYDNKKMLDGLDFCSKDLEIWSESIGLL